MIEAPGIIEHLHSDRKKYLACLRAALISLSHEDNLVYHGHAGHFLLRGVPHTIKVRVIANMEFRIQALINHQRLSREEAIEYIERVDEERARWTRFLYHADWSDPSLYDMVIHLGHMTLSGACDMLFHLANLNEFQATTESQKMVDDLVLSSNLQAVIANARNISGGEDVEIEADAGLITITGTVESMMDADRVVMIVRKTPGVKDITSHMRVRFPGLPVITTDDK